MPICAHKVQVCPPRDQSPASRPGVWRPGILQFQTMLYRSPVICATSADRQRVSNDIRLRPWFDWRQVGSRSLNDKMGDKQSNLSQTCW